MKYSPRLLLIICILLFPLNASAFGDKLSGCMCKSENGYIPNAFLVKNQNVWTVSRCAQGDHRNWCISSRYSFSSQGNEMVFETKSVVGAKDTWRINLVTGRTTQRIDDNYGKAIGGDLCDCQFAEDIGAFMEGLLTELN